MTRQQQTAIDHHCRLAAECVHPRFRSVGPGESVKTFRRFRDFLGLVLYPRMQEENDVDALLELVEQTFTWEQRALMTLAHAERILARFRRERPR